MDSLLTSGGISDSYKKSAKAYNQTRELLRIEGSMDPLCLVETDCQKQLRRTEAAGPHYWFQRGEFRCCWGQGWAGCCIWQEWLVSLRVVRQALLRRVVG